MDERIVLSHGSGGRAMHELIDSLFVKTFDDPALREQADAAIVAAGGRKLAFTTDSYVVKPVFFPGGDIGSLAVYGTVNDLAVCGARPLFISCGIIIEEGLERAVLARIIRSMAVAARKAGVRIVTGDTKVVEKGSCDSVYISTSGIGEIVYPGLSLAAVRPGDLVVVSGPVGDHAVAVLSKREGIAFGTTVKSDAAPLGAMIGKALAVSKKIRIMRDPTRGGLATTLNEFTRGRAFGIALNERAVPVRPGTRQACELLGLDPLYLACEGRAVMIVAREDAARVVRALRKDPAGRGARAIGVVTKEHPGRVWLETAAGGRRLVDMLTGEQLPRIC